MTKSKMNKVNSLIRWSIREFGWHSSSAVRKEEIDKYTEYYEQYGLEYFKGNKYFYYKTNLESKDYDVKLGNLFSKLEENWLFHSTMTELHEIDVRVDSLYELFDVVRKTAEYIGYGINTEFTIKLLELLNYKKYNKIHIEYYSDLGQMRVFDNSNCVLFALRRCDNAR